MVVNDLQRSTGHGGQICRIAGQPGQYAGTPFGCLVEQNGTTRIGLGQGFGHQFGFFDLENHLDAAFERSLHGRHGFRVEFLRWCENQQVAEVLDVGDDALGRDFVFLAIFLVVSIVSVITVGGFLWAPSACEGVDKEAQLLLEAAATPATVDPPDLCGGGVGQCAKLLGLFVRALELDAGLPFLDTAIRARQKAVGGLKLESLTLSLFIIGGNALGGPGFHCFDTVEFAYPVVLTQWCATVFADIDRRLLRSRIAGMAVTAATAHKGGQCGECDGAGNVAAVACAEFGAYHAEHPALVVDETAWSEL